MKKRVISDTSSSSSSSSEEENEMVDILAPDEDPVPAAKRLAQDKILTRELRESLERDGAVIVPSVLPPALCKELHEEMLEYHRKWNPALEPDRPQNWTGERKPPGPHGLNQFDGHQPFCWKVRQHPRVVQVFAELYDVRPQDLLVSFDGFRFLIKGRKYLNDLTRHRWGHTDQGKHMYNDAYQCVQASVAVTSSADWADGDFVFWKHSHKAHRGYFEKHPDAFKDKKGKETLANWYKYPGSYFDEIERDGTRYMRPSDRPEDGSPVPMSRVRVRRHAGDMVLWYSTTTHQSQPPTIEARHDAAAIFVCMAPRKHATAKELERRVKAFEERRTTCHWPVRGFKMFQKVPFRSDPEAFKRGKEGVGSPEPQPTALGRRLIGYVE